MGEFLTDVESLRSRAREHIEKGAVTQSYMADLPRVIAVLNAALASEIVCVLRYKRHYFTATGIHAANVAEEFLEHANDEQAHVDRIAERIVQLGGQPDFNPEGLATRSHSQYDGSDDLIAMVKEDLIAERIVIESYQEIIRWLGNDDPTTRRMFEELLANEEDHADDLLSILQEMDGSMGKATNN